MAAAPMQVLYLFILGKLKDDKLPSAIVYMRVLTSRMFVFYIYFDLRRALNLHLFLENLLLTMVKGMHLFVLCILTLDRQTSLLKQLFAKVGCFPTIGILNSGVMVSVQSVILYNYIHLRSISTSQLHYN